MSAPALAELRLGLCCQFAREPIKFRTTTATAMLRLPRPQRLARLAELCCSNPLVGRMVRRGGPTSVGRNSL